MAAKCGDPKISIHITLSSLGDGIEICVCGSQQQIFLCYTLSRPLEPTHEKSLQFLCLHKKWTQVTPELPVDLNKILITRRHFEPPVTKAKPPILVITYYIICVFEHY